jgi:hypothetical protein
MAVTLVTNARLQFIGIVLEIAGIASAAGGVILTFSHRFPIAPSPARLFFSSVNLPK